MFVAGLTFVHPIAFQNIKWQQFQILKNIWFNDKINILINTTHIFHNTFMQHVQQSEETLCLWLEFVGDEIINSSVKCRVSNASTEKQLKEKLDIYWNENALHTMLYLL